MEGTPQFDQEVNDYYQLRLAESFWKKELHGKFLSGEEREALRARVAERQKRYGTIRIDVATTDTEGAERGARLLTKQYSDPKPSNAKYSSGQRIIATAGPMKHCLATVLGYRDGLMWYQYDHHDSPLPTHPTAVKGWAYMGECPKGVEVEEPKVAVAETEEEVTLENTEEVKVEPASEGEAKVEASEESEVKGAAAEEPKVEAAEETPAEAETTEEVPEVKAEPEATAESTEATEKVEESEAKPESTEDAKVEAAAEVTEPEATPETTKEKDTTEAKAEEPEAVPEAVEATEEAKVDEVKTDATEETKAEAEATPEEKVDTATEAKAEEPAAVEEAKVDEIKTDATEETKAEPEATPEPTEEKVDTATEAKAEEKVEATEDTKVDEETKAEPEATVETTDETKANAKSDPTAVVCHDTSSHTTSPHHTHHTTGMRHADAQTSHISRVTSRAEGRKPSCTRQYLVLDKTSKLSGTVVPQGIPL